MIPRSMILRDMKAEYMMKKNTTPMNQLFFIDDLKPCRSKRNQLDSLAQNARIFSEVIRMKIGLDKCAITEVK